MTIIEQLARELDRPVEHIENVRQTARRGQHHPVHRPLPQGAARLDGRSPPCATLEERLALSAQSRQNARRALRRASHEQEQADRRACRRHRRGADARPRSRIFTVPTSPSAAPARPSPRKRGLEPLAALLFAQERDCPRPEEAAADYLSAEKGVETVADALQGANDIVAEWISDDAAVRKSRCGSCWSSAACSASLAATEEDSVYRLYYDFEQPLSRLPGPPDPRHQPRREGGNAEGRPSCWTASWRCRLLRARGGEARLRRHGVC